MKPFTKHLLTDGLLLWPLMITAFIGIEFAVTTLSCINWMSIGMFVLLAFQFFTGSNLFDSSKEGYTPNHRRYLLFSTLIEAAAFAAFGYYALAFLWLFTIYQFILHQGEDLI